MEGEESLWSLAISTRLVRSGLRKCNMESAGKTCLFDNRNTTDIKLFLLAKLEYAESCQKSTDPFLNHLAPIKVGLSISEIINRGFSHLLDSTRKSEDWNPPTSGQKRQRKHFLMSPVFLRGFLSRLYPTSKKSTQSQSRRGSLRHNRSPMHNHTMSLSLSRPFHTRSI